MVVEDNLSRVARGELYCRKCGEKIKLSSSLRLYCPSSYKYGLSEIERSEHSFFVSKEEWLKKFEVKEGEVPF